MKLSPVVYETVLNELTQALAQPGLLLVVPDAKRPANPMTIGWATFGRIWGQPICTVLVRPSRYTFDLLNKAGVFTVNLMPSSMTKAVGRCGSVSGRDVDKIAEQGWTVCQGETLAVPYLAEAALHIECRTVMTSAVTPELDAELRNACYPRGDMHTVYYGLVTAAYRHD